MLKYFFEGPKKATQDKNGTKKDIYWISFKFRDKECDDELVELLKTPVMDSIRELIENEYNLYYSDSIVYPFNLIINYFTYNESETSEIRKEFEDRYVPSIIQFYEAEKSKFMAKAIK